MTMTTHPARGTTLRHGGRLEDLIGHTPVMAIRVDDDCVVHAKLEMFNPLSSVKDRVARRMLDGAEERGDLRAGGHIVEATSGNTGIALAALAGARGYRCTVVMPDSATVERRDVLLGFGARVELTPASGGYQAAIDRALEFLAVEPDSWFARQHDNADNVAAHRETTGPELLEQMEGRIDILVCGIGTGGTITGTGSYLRGHLPLLRIVGVEPAESPVLSLGYPGTHRIPGLNGGFVAPTTDVALIDEVVRVSSDDALEGMRLLMRRHGLFAGVSSGAAFHAAAEVARRRPDARVATVLPDGGDRYLSLLVPALPGS